MIPYFVLYPLFFVLVPLVIIGVFGPCLIADILVHNFKRPHR